MSKFLPKCHFLSSALSPLMRYMPMVKSLVFSIIFMFCIAPQSKANASAKISNPHLYALEKDGKLSFILGTVHFGVDKNEFPEFVTVALERQNLFVSEALKGKKKKKHMDSFSTLSSNTGATLLLRGMSKEDINSYRPDTLCMVYLYWDYLDEDTENKYVLDGQFSQHATLMGKELRELDVNEKLVDDAIRELFDCDLPSFIKQFPLDSVSSKLDEIQKSSRDEYRNGGENYLDNRGDFEQSTLDRNQSWVPLVIKYHSEEFFGVVGAAHLDPFHEKGLLTLLEGNGFVVTRMDSEHRFRELIKKYEN